MNYLNFAIWCDPWGTYVALPEAYEHLLIEGDPIIKTDGDGRDWVEPEGCIELSDDPTEAERLLALRLHLDDFKTKMIINDKEISVGPHKMADRIGPDEIMARCKLLRESFTERLKYASYGGLVELGYDRAKEYIQPEYLKVGIHDCLNTLYAIVHTGDHDYIAAWKGETPPDRRGWRTAYKSEWLVLTDSEADEECDDRLESMLDDEGIVPGASSPYFDRKRWKSDAMIDGRGHYISSYDGGEWSAHLDSETYYLYRTN